MTKSEMQIFIDEMEQIGDIWTLDEVSRCYAETSLEDALLARKADVEIFLSGLGQAATYLKSKKD